MTVELPDQEKNENEQQTFGVLGFIFDLFGALIDFAGVYVSMAMIVFTVLSFFFGTIGLILMFFR